MCTILLCVCVLDGLSLAPAGGSFARSQGSGGGVPACFAPGVPLPRAPGARGLLRGADGAACVHTVLRRTPCRVPGRARVLGPAGGPAGRAGPLQMIMPGGSGFEEAEQVAERLFRLKTAVQTRENESGSSKRPGPDLSGEEEMAEKRVFEVELQRPLGFTLKDVAGYGIYVDYVESGGFAEAMGVQRGDKILATSATLGGGMWEKSSMEGVLAALHSGTMFQRAVRIRFERDPVLASIVGFSAESSTSRVDIARALISVERARLRIQQTTTETFEVALPLPGKDKSFTGGDNPFSGNMPYGLRLQQDEDGVVVAEISPEGTAAQSGLLRVGDRIVATSGSIGSSLWPKKTLDGILSATRTRMSSSITFQIERKVQLGSWQQVPIDSQKSAYSDFIQ